MAHSISAEFILDYEGEEPKRLVRLTMDSDTVSFLGSASKAHGDASMLRGDRTTAGDAYGMSQMFERIGNELSARSLFSQEEFKATKPKTEDEL